MWDVGTTAEEFIHEAKNAVFVMVGFVSLLWVVELANWADNGRLAEHYGIIPRHLSRLPDILTAPFLHFSWTHIEANSGPLFIFGLLAAYRGVRRFLVVTLVVALVSGMAVWLFQSSHDLTVGASGLIYGYFGYIVVKGFFDRHLIDVLLGLVMALSFAYILVGVVPGTPRVSWIDHLGGVIGGVASGWLLRSGGPSGRRSGGVPGVQGPATIPGIS